LRVRIPPEVPKYCCMNRTHELSDSEVMARFLRAMNISSDHQLKRPRKGSPAITAQYLLEPIIRDRGRFQVDKSFIEHGPKPIAAALQKLFEGSKSSGGGETWFFRICLAAGCKLCKKCNRILILDSFHRDTTRNIGVVSDCKDCVSIDVQGNYRKYYDSFKRSERKNRGAIALRRSIRRASRLKRVPPWAELDQIREFYHNRPDGYHVDHIIPLLGKTVSGLHVLANLQYLPAEENLKKGNRISLEDV
jgi:hypothetical protein